MPLGSKMAPPWGSLAPKDLQWEKYKKKLQHHMAQSFYILYVAMCSGPGIKNGVNPGWSLAPVDLQLEKYKKKSPKSHTQSFHILCGTMYITHLYKSCQ